MGSPLRSFFQYRVKYRVFSKVYVSLRVNPSAAGGYFGQYSYPMNTNMTGFRGIF